MRRKIIITGVAEMIKIKKLKYFLKKNFEVYGIDCKKHILVNKIKNIKSKKFNYYDCDLSKEQNVKKLYNIFKENKFDSLWHLAANSDIQKGSKNTKIELNNTFLTTFNSIKLAEKLNISNFCFTSSSAIYGESNLKFKENFGPLRPISNYGAMKASSESIIHANAKIFDKIFIFRFPNVISSDVTHGLFFDMQKKIKKSNKINIFGFGLQKKPYMHVDTLIKIINFLYESKKMHKTNIFNIGPDDNGITVKEIIKKFVKIKKLQNKNFTYEAKKRGWDGDVINYKFDVSKIKKILNFKIPSSIKAVEKTIKEIIL